MSMLIIFLKKRATEIHSSVRGIFAFEQAAPPQFPEVAKRLIRHVGREPVSIKSTSGARNAMYWGFDTTGVSEGDLKIFFRRLADAINDLL
jgi:hypothetical protein